MKILNNTGSRTGPMKPHSVFPSSLTAGNCPQCSFTFVVHAVTILSSGLLNSLFMRMVHKTGKCFETICT